MVLANAIYFKGTWEKQFISNDTRKRDFVVGPNDLIKVDLMNGKFKAASGVNKELDCKVLQLPYVGNELSMIFILPNDQNGLSKLESSLTFSTFNRIMRATIKQETIICIPKFVVETHYDLKPILSKLSITEIFDHTAADFTNMILPDECSPGAYISTAIHIAVIEVNEEGSEAAAATV
jgi:serpin B